jgi:hypothetical protein
VNQQVLFANDVFVQLAMHVDFTRAYRPRHLAFVANQQVISDEFAGHIAIDHRLARRSDGALECDAFANHEVVVVWVDIRHACPLKFVLILIQDA